jgi:hypothetical protein
MRRGQRTSGPKMLGRETKGDSHLIHATELSSRVPTGVGGRSYRSIVRSTKEQPACTFLGPTPFDDDILFPVLRIKTMLALRRRYTRKATVL